MQPQPACPVFSNVKDIIGWQSILDVVVLKAISVEAGNTLLSIKPNVAFAVLHSAINGICWQDIIYSIALLAELLSQAFGMKKSH